MIDIKRLSKVIVPLTKRLQRLETQEFPDPPTPPVTSMESARASGNLVLTGSFADVAGCSLTLAPGEYLITGVFCIDGGADADNDAFAYFNGRLLVDGVAEAGQAHANLAWQDTRGAPAFVKGLWTVVQQWHITIVTAAKICKLQANKSGTFITGNSQINITDTVITAIGVLT